jgi:hypothetical protein
MDIASSSSSGLGFHPASSCSRRCRRGPVEVAEATTDARSCRRGRRATSHPGHCRHLTPADPPGEQRLAAVGAGVTVVVVVIVGCRRVTRSRQCRRGPVVAAWDGQGAAVAPPAPGDTKEIHLASSGSRAWLSSRRRWGRDPPPREQWLAAVGVVSK